MRYYLTTAIPYVNAHPHLGFVLEVVQADAYARFLRARGDEVYFVTGTDENSLKNVISARKRGITPQQLVDNNSALFRQLKTVFHLSYDDFIRTTEARHQQGVAKLWRAIQQKGDIYKKKYKGLYCVECEAFYKPEDLIDGLCPIHHTKPEVVEEENYFFRLSRYQKQLGEIITNNHLEIIPAKRKQEMLYFLKEGLEDFSISRSQKRAGNWGIPVPGDPQQVIYVWIDALSNYINALNYYQDDNILFKKWWRQADKIIHFIGKGINRFHSIYWPGLLLSAGLRLPTTIFVHGYLTINGEKISKSLGNGIDPFLIAQQYDPEVIRYFLLREISPFEDGDFSEHRLQERYNGDLSRGIGNLLSRVLALGEGLTQGIILSKITGSWQRLVKETYDIYEQEMQEFRFNNALAVVSTLASKSDYYISQEKPWACSDKEKLQQIMANLVYALSYISLMLFPAMPQSSQAILSSLQLNKIDEDKWLQQVIHVRKRKPLFPKLNKE